jgi:hypothetical protein
MNPGAASAPEVQSAIARLRCALPSEAGRSPRPAGRAAHSGRLDRSDQLLRCDAFVVRHRDLRRQQIRLDAPDSGDRLDGLFVTTR